MRCTTSSRCISPVTGLSACSSCTSRLWYASRSIVSASAYPVFQYNVFSLFFSWFAPANLWLTFSIVIDLTTTQGIEVFGTQGAVSILRSIAYLSGALTGCRPCGSTKPSSGYGCPCSPCSSSLRSVIVLRARRWRTL